MPKVFAWVTAVFTVASGLQYIVQGLKQLNPPATTRRRAVRAAMSMLARPRPRPASSWPPCAPRTPAARGRAPAGRPHRGHQRPAAPRRHRLPLPRAASRRACGSSVERAGRRERACSAHGAPTSASSSSRRGRREIATCANKCVFCFIHQLPRGMRKSLYVKDDDFRLSFLHGNYITLTDLDEDELARIEAQRLSPALRLGPRDRSGAAPPPPRPSRGSSRELLPVMERLARRASACTRRSCSCPDWNDGAQLERSVRELARLHPAVATHGGGARGPHAPPRAAARSSGPSPTTRRARSCGRSRAGRRASWPRSARASCGPPTSCTCRRAPRCRRARAYEGFADRRGRHRARPPLHRRMGARARRPPAPPARARAR